MSEPVYTFFAAASRGVAPLLSAELRALGAEQVDRTGAGASFRGTLAMGYRVCMWSRMASRVLLQLARVHAATADALYEGVLRLPWGEHLAPTGTLAVRFNGTTAEIRNSHFGALRVKDAIVDHFRGAHGSRPSVNLERPDVRIDVHLYKAEAVVSLDLSGGGLHRRGYRVETTEAPLKENLAAALLARAGWPAIVARHGSLVDPMCGSGTLLIEAAWMAMDRAPALGRQDLGLLSWRGHDAQIWSLLEEEARERMAASRKQLPAITGFDADVRAVRASLANLERAGLAGAVHVERRSLADSVIATGRPGLLVTNPPYGHRLSDEGGVRALHAELTTRLRSHYGGWRAAVLTTTPEWAQSLGIECLPETFANGPLECRLLLGDLPGPALATPAKERAPADAYRGSGGMGDGTGAEMFANRLRKNLKTIGKWARRSNTSCYRLYDADMPEYAVAVDIYQGTEKTWAHVQEYRAPASVDPGRAAGRLQEVLTTIPQVLEIPGDQLYFKVREKKRGTTQYRRLTAGGGAFREVTEGPCTFLVNFTDYLDTGLFLDHRLTRSMIGDMAAGKRFLNLFAYTGTATVHAALGGARSTTTIDMSQTYTDWAIRNFTRNGMSGSRNLVEQTDCLQWLETPRRDRYDLIFLDPPTFSNSKRMERDSFDVQRDHAWLIRKTMKLLADGGVLLFSTNFRQFQLEESELTGIACQDISRQTLPKDFESNPRIHRCYRMTVA
ncbi:MAG: bifunctional 23S rRNA (guanine(2069)-N(7))-methyltransferase RlmK/23S rRNA (guanine(2445)-N(2))-methyltransferase RlmL [bacterium]|nr:bifunctional 23S rRNA (guanine(2069)-N(7))-methyltransferase RlmK/23S rRNA (guanine(2445)-N(2))-methyltransferase RlmL [bacterium]